MSYTRKEMVEKVKRGEIRKEDIHIRSIPERIEEDTEYLDVIADMFDKKTAVEMILADGAARGEIGCYYYNGELYYGDRDEIKKFWEELKTL